MSIVLKKQVTQHVTQTVEVDQVFEIGFYELKYGGLMAIYSEDKVISVFTLNNYCAVSIGNIRTQSMCNPVILNEITEQDFNNELAKAVFMISGIEVVPTLARQTAY